MRCDTHAFIFNVFEGLWTNADVAAVKATVEHLVRCFCCLFVFVVRFKVAVDMCNLSYMCGSLCWCSFVWLMCGGNLYFVPEAMLMHRGNISWRT